MEEFVLYEIQKMIDYCDSVRMFWNVSLLDAMKGFFAIDAIYMAFHLAMQKALEEREEE